MKLQLKLLYKVAFAISLLGLIAIVAEIGFSQSRSLNHILEGFYIVVLGVGVVSTVVRYRNNWRLVNRKVFIFDLLSVIFTLWIYYTFVFVGSSFETDAALDNPIWVKIAVLFTLIREFSDLRINFRRTFLNPAQLFILSFLVIIFTGSLLLTLPNATYNGISYVDALFTATSAVCVTGLAVVVTATHFTLFGQTIIMMLIQIGGLGILTFASYFSYFFKGGTTYENQLALGYMTSSRKLGEVFSTLKYILLITFGIELLAAILIYTSVDSEKFSSVSEQLFFSAFHAISAFCNAGFSTLPNNLMETGFVNNYNLQLVVIFTFVLGGLGFPIVVNILKYLKYSMVALFAPGKRIYRPWVLNLNSRITLITTLAVMLVGFISFYFLEYDNTLAAHEGFGKVVTALFGATTPRTAGFNTIDTGAMKLTTVTIVIILMWIGASPQSTGGGIKTSTFAIAILNILSLAKGKSKIEIYRREIANVSVRRAFGIMSLSLFVIGVGILLISTFDPEKQMVDIAFECFSAYSTAGLSLGITGDLTDASKLVVSAVMFIGRISMLSLVIAVFKKIKHKNYKYPTEEITIN